jgi:hypothetical protein
VGNTTAYRPGDGIDGVGGAASEDPSMLTSDV